MEALSFAKELNDKEKINLVRYIVLMSKNSKRQAMKNLIMKVNFLDDYLEESLVVPIKV